MMLGELFLHGKGAPRDEAEARRLFELAAAQGQAHAQAGLAEMLLSDSMSGPDEVGKAKRLLVLAVAKGEADAQALLGKLTFQFEGPEGMGEARRLCELAKAQGHTGV